jgi:hypothetical protein
MNVEPLMANSPADDAEGRYARKQALQQFINASTARIEQRTLLEMARELSASGAKDHAEVAMRRSMEESLEPELLRLLNPRYEGALTGDRGRILIDMNDRHYYIRCDPFPKSSAVATSGWFGMVLPRGNQQLAAICFHAENFQDDLLQVIRRSA